MSLTCRNCEAVLDEKILHLPSMPLTDEFVRVQDLRHEYLSDIDIYSCNACGLVQNPSDFDHEGYYEDYEYSSGHSEFTQSFMLAYAKAVCDIFSKTNGNKPLSVLEIGSGDGEQLRAFRSLGVNDLLGIEPSAALVTQSESIGIKALKGLFSLDTVAQLDGRKFDICISSYTLDHVRSPVGYLKAAHALLKPGGVLAFEVHDLHKIETRSEWCLFEHEHTIYMDESMASAIISEHGFEVLAINPLPESSVRANSLIVLATKSDQFSVRPKPLRTPSDLQSRIHNAIAKVDQWLRNLPSDDQVVGYGVGGRGIMTLAALKEHKRFSTIFDSNYQSGKYLTPKTRIPVSGPESLEEYKRAWCLVFSFGYLAEIKELLVKKGYSAERIIPLNDFYG